MQVIIKETRELVNLEYINENGIDIALDIMGNWGFTVTGYDEYCTPVMHAEDVAWWADILERMENLEAAGVDWDSCEFRCETDLGMMVEDLERANA